MPGSTGHYFYFVRPAFFKRDSIGEEGYTPGLLSTYIKQTTKFVGTITTSKNQFNSL